MPDIQSETEPYPNLYTRRKRGVGDSFRNHISVTHWKFNHGRPPHLPHTFSSILQPCYHPFPFALMSYLLTPYFSPVPSLISWILTLPHSPLHHLLLSTLFYGLSPLLPPRGTVPSVPLSLPASLPPSRPRSAKCPSPLPSTSSPPSWGQERVSLASCCVDCRPCRRTSGNWAYPSSCFK